MHWHLPARNKPQRCPGKLLLQVAAAALPRPAKYAWQISLALPLPPTDMLSIATGTITDRVSNEEAATSP